MNFTTVRAVCHRWPIIFLTLTTVNRPARKMVLRCGLSLFVLLFAMLYNLFNVSSQHPRIMREDKTVAAMIALYCHQHHSGDGLCPECSALLDYTRQRLDKCPFQEGKTTCAKCPVHCFQPAMRERIRAVMRYSGPRMIFRHPIAAIRHLIDGRRKEPVTRVNKTV